MAESEPEQQVARLFRELGAEPAQARIMAAQLVKRAGQLAGEQGSSIEDALAGLLRRAVDGRLGKTPGEPGGSQQPERK